MTAFAFQALVTIDRIVMLEGGGIDMKIKRTLTEVLDFPDDMPWEDAAELLVNGGEEEELVPADEVEEEDYEDEDA